MAEANPTIVGLVLEWRFDSDWLKHYGALPLSPSFGFQTVACGGWFDARYLSPPAVEKFWEAQRLNSGEINEQRYGIGWRARPES